MRSSSRSLAIPAVLVIGLAVSSVDANADPVTIDFESAPASFTSYTESGATISAVDGRLVNRSPSPNETLGIISSAGPGFPFVELKAEFTAQPNSVSIDLGDFGGDADTLFLEAFNSANALVAFTSFLLPPAMGGMRTLELTALSGAGVSYVVFGGRAPSLSGSSVWADNLRFEQADPVPEPTSMLLLGSGLLGVGVRRWRQKRR